LCGRGLVDQDVAYVGQVERGALRAGRAPRRRSGPRAAGPAAAAAPPPRRGGRCAGRPPPRPGRRARRPPERLTGRPHEIVSMLVRRHRGRGATPSAATAVDHLITRSAPLIAHRQQQPKTPWPGRCRSFGVAVYCHVLWTTRQLKKSSREIRTGKGGGRSPRPAAGALVATCGLPPGSHPGVRELGGASLERENLGVADHAVADLGRPADGLVAVPGVGPVHHGTQVRDQRLADFPGGGVP